MRLLIPVLLNCVLVFAVYLADKYTPAKNLPHMAKQVIIGLLFGCISAFASSYGVQWLGTTVNVRDAAPLSAGLIFGAPAGIMSGFIGGLYRWFSVYWGGGTYTQLACSMATILAGFMAAGLRKLMFDNKKPTWFYGICIAVVCEVIHMILIFLTNMDNSSYAFEFVKGATIPMILGNAAAVGSAIIIVSVLSHERFSRNKGGERIANTFQRWLLLCIVVAYLVTSIFTYILQNGIVKIETQEVFTSAINDVEADVKGKSDAALLQIAQNVKTEYESDPSIALSALKEKYNVVEINIISSIDTVEKSTEDGNVGYDMNLSEQSKEFIDILKEQDHFVQKYSPRGIDGTVWRKYAAIRLT